MLEIVQAGGARQGPSAPPSSPESPVLQAALISVFCSTPLSDKDSSYLLPLCHPGLSMGVQGHSLLCGHCDCTRTCKRASPRAVGEQQGSKTKSTTSLDHLAPQHPRLLQEPPATPLLGSAKERTPSSHPELRPGHPALQRTLRGRRAGGRAPSRPALCPWPRCVL